MTDCCATIGCTSPAEKEWGIDRVKCCASCHAELEAELAALRVELAELERELERQRIE